MSHDAGRTFTSPSIIPGTAEPELGASGGLQGLFMPKLAVDRAGAIAVVHSHFSPGERSRIRLVRGRAPTPAQ